MEQGTAGNIKKAKSPKKYWSYAALTFSSNTKRDRIICDESSTYELPYQGDHKNTLLSFGCEVNYMESLQGLPKTNTFEPRSKRGMFLTYDMGGAIVALDNEAYKSGINRMTVTRDLTLTGTSFHGTILCRMRNTCPLRSRSKPLKNPTSKDNVGHL